MNTQYYLHPLRQYFKDMVRRGKHLGCEFTWGLKDFNRWLDVVGPIPEGIEVPTIGRYDHELGYVFDTENNRWNFRWQEMAENSREGALRSGLGRNLEHNRRISVLAGLAVAKSPNRVGLRIFTCPYCDRVGKGPAMLRHHFNHCPKRPKT
jgi:hypothetical protein